MTKFNQTCLLILKETSLASFPGGVFGDGPGSITNDPNILATMSACGSTTPQKINSKKRKKIFKRPLNKTL